MIPLLLIAALWCGGLTVDRIEGPYAVVECYRTGTLRDVPAHPLLTEGSTFLRQPVDVERQQRLPRAPSGDLDI